MESGYVIEDYFFTDRLNCLDVILFGCLINYFLQMMAHKSQEFKDLMIFTYLNIFRLTNLFGQISNFMHNIQIDFLKI